MTVRELHTQLRSPQPPTLLHVLPPEVFAATRIPGSQNACVYEMTFLDQVRTLVPDTSAPIVVHGAGEGSLDAATAAEKLRAAGCAQVQPFDGGLAEWKAAGLPLEVNVRVPRRIAAGAGIALPDAAAAVDIHFVKSALVRLIGGFIAEMPFAEDASRRS